MYVNSIATTDIYQQEINLKAHDKTYIMVKNAPLKNILRALLG
jgi:hypothetical protein